MNSLILAAALLAPLKTAPGLGTAPAATRIPMLASLDLTRVTPVIAPLGAKDYAVSIAPLRGERGAVVGSVGGLALIEAPLVSGDDWTVTALLVGNNRHELAGSWPLPALRKQPLSAELGGRDWTVSLTEDADPAVRFEAKTNPLGGLQLPFSVLKRAVWGASAPVPAMGPEWRLAFNADLWRGAGMRSFVFMRALSDGSVEFYRTGAEAVDGTRALPRRVGPVTVSLQLDPENRLVVTRLP
ncbi:MAG: hypothetical protein FD126_2448 [Elusimicrobia bacterium]|nr:MAG: hypothetical protein FD126_2448 [Elusimicrobiota bacterium]